MIKKLPNCAKDGCKNLGFVSVYGRFYCGECTVEMTQNAQVKVNG